jgi:DNA repair protein RadA
MAEMDRQQSLPETAFRTADQMARRVVSTGNASLDTLLGGGLEIGLMHLFYGDRCLVEDLLRAAVQAQLPEERGGMNSPTIIIDSANIIKIEKLTDYSFDMGLEPEDVMDHIYISRAFNSSQTYDLVMNQLEHFFERVPARLLIVSGLPDLYIAEGTTGESLQQISHMATKLMAFTLNRGIATLLSAPASDRNPELPAGGRALSSCAQVHIQVAESKAYFKYTLTKHPQYPVRRTSRSKPVSFGTTLPLSCFLDEKEKE